MPDEYDDFRVDTIMKRLGYTDKTARQLYKFKKIPVFPLAASDHHGTSGDRTRHQEPRRQSHSDFGRFSVPGFSVEKRARDHLALNPIAHLRCADEGRMDRCESNPAHGLWNQYSLRRVSDRTRTAARYG